MPGFNSNLTHIQPSASMKIGLSVNDSSLFNLSIGVPDLPPPETIATLVQTYGNSNRFPYVPSRGSLKARENLSCILFPADERPDPESGFILVNGAKYGIYLTLKTCTNPGDTVVLMEPYWLSYPQMAFSLGLKTVFWKPSFSEENSLSFDLTWFEDYCRIHRPSALIFNNPNNPSGKVFDADFIGKLSSLTARYDCWLIIDEVYKHQTYSGDFPAIPPAEHIVRIGSLSKSISVPGLRLGYIAASSTMIEKADLLNQHLLTCVCAISNYVGEEISAETFHKYREYSTGIYLKRFEEFNRLFSGKFQIIKAEASFYALIKPLENSSGEVTSYLKEHFRILATPGAAYGDWFSDFARICLTVDLKVLAENIHKS